MHDVLIIGGGIGGLAAGAALQSQGINAQVYEAAPELRAVGAGIWIPPNAMTVLERLGLAGEVTEAGIALERLEVRDLEDGVLQAMDGAEIRARWGHATVAIRRSELQRILAAALQPGTLHLGKCLQYFEDRGTDIRAHFEDGTDARGKLLVGADGLHSAVRRQLFPHVSLRYSGQTCLRGLAGAAMPEAMQRTAWEVWGGAARFGFSAVDPERVYWFAPIKTPAGQQWDPGEASRRLVEQYASFPDPIPAIIGALEPEAIIQTDLYDFAPIKRWHRGNVLLIGDAAHATTPNLGQGGAQAIEDALSLALKLDEEGLSPAALESVEETRRPKASKVVNTSWQLGKIAHWENRYLRRARNFALRSTPARFRERQLNELFTARL